MIVPERYSDEGIGRVYGGDLLLKVDNGHKLYGWIAYTLLKSERQGSSRRSVAAVRVRSDAHPHRRSPAITCRGRSTSACASAT